MYNVVVIGIGKLGVRHLQALLGCKEDINLYAVDNSLASIDRANSLIESIENKRIKYVKISGNMDLLPTNIDIAVIATSSAVRASIIKELLTHCNVKYMVLEKVLFQAIDEYNEIESLLERKKIKAWINCPRRMMSGYKRIKEEFATDQIQKVVIHGGNWNLGCNCIHMVDLISYFIGDLSSLTCSGQLLDERIIESKRAGYVEFTGSLVGNINGTTDFIITSSADSSRPVSMCFFSEKAHVLIDEGRQIAHVIKGGSIETISSPILYQSQMTNIVAEQLMNTGDCELTPFSISCRLHIPMIKVFIEHQKKFGNGDGKLCRIT